MQFGLRALLCTTTFVAISVAFRPDPSRGPETAHYLFTALTAVLGCSFLLTDAAWRLGRNRESAVAERRFNSEQLALVLATCGTLPFAALWLFLLVEPYESKGAIVHQLLLGLWYLELGIYLPAALSILASFPIYFEPRRNPPLFALRLMWAVALVAVPLFIYFFILPRLG
jgi:hypothetical protein